MWYQHGYHVCRSSKSTLTHVHSPCGESVIFLLLMLSECVVQSVWFGSDNNNRHAPRSGEGGRSATGSKLWKRLSNPLLVGKPVVWGMRFPRLYRLNWMADIQPLPNVVVDCDFEGVRVTALKHLVSIPAAQSLCTQASVASATQSRLPTCVWSPKCTTPIDSRCAGERLFGRVIENPVLGGLSGVLVGEKARDRI